MLARKIFFTIMVIILAVSCSTKKELLAEPVKDLNATWHIQNVTRNTVDITQYIDASDFKLTLSPDNTYKLEGNNIPFLVNSASGTWSSDDPQYPYNITFKPTDNSADSVSASMATPVSKGQRTLSITFSPGCHSNTYIYTFEKSN